MTEADKKALLRMTGGGRSQGASTDDLQGLLLQVVFALLMIFMIAYFIFVASAKKVQEEQMLDLNRQKLVLALDKVVEDHRIRYGLNALMTQGTDGSRVFDADEHVKGGRLALSPAAKSAFSAGSAAAASDYADPATLRDSWRTEVLSAADLLDRNLTADEKTWLDAAIDDRIETVRLDTRGVQRALATRLQFALIENPEGLGEAADAGALADLIKRKSLELVKEAIGGEVLP